MAVFVQFLSVFLLFLTIQQSPGLECGQVPLGGLWSKEASNHRIFGGQTFSFHFMPWLVVIHLPKNRVCTGSLIAPNYVLTAKHCFMGLQQYYSSFVINVGYGNVAKDQMEITTVVGIFDHPNVDISILKLKDTIYQTPVCLPQMYNADCSLEKNLVLAGFGRYLPADYEPKWTRNGTIVRRTPGNLADSAMWANIQQLDRTNCILDRQQYIQPTEFCAGGLGSGSMDGDSGGPVMKVVGDRVIQIGTTSRGFQTAINNRMYDTGIYVNVGVHARWIAETTNGAAQFRFVRGSCTIN